MKLFRILMYLMVIMIAASSYSLGLHAQETEEIHENSVHFVPVEQTVERGLESFLDRSIDTAVEEGADHVVLEIDTPGGAVDAAGNIAQIVRNAEVPTTAFVTGEAMSAGAYIALNANQIVMAPGTTMGSAQVVDGTGNAAETKAQSAWVSNMVGAAENNDRDPQYAEAMANPDLVIEELNVGEGDLLTLTSSQALEVGYAEEVANDREQLLQFLEMEEAEIVESEVSFAEQIARFVTSPVVIPILLSLGSIGLVLELFSPGFGIPGLLGLSSLLLFFFGHLIAGFAGMETIILFIAGVILLLVEVFFPGFGIFGILGVGAVITSMLLASFSTVYMLLAILIAAIVSGVVAVILFKYFGQRGPMKRMVLHDATTTDEGYISNESRAEIVGQIGETITPLRPAGSMILNDERLDVVSEGGYIEQGRKAKVVSAVGSRIIVREVAAEQELNHE
ncbi:NfeD family protein [Salsuginibacillus kocurii]|uniref:NfeD family protein n=1 Tax=Salsuginibacillus kocurii TaxID=427078 RepID=UPI00037BFAE5|nr:nodulation protein NfeD [Salsuginibacillus kocurii]